MEKAKTAKSNTKTKDIKKPETTKKSTYDKKDIEDGKAMGILAYLNFLSLIPFFAEKKNKFVVYHAKQGLNLFILTTGAAIAISILFGIIICMPILWGLLFIASLLSTAVGIFTLVMSILGIIQVINGKTEELPLIGKIKIIK